MAKIKITETNGASAKDISDAIGKFLENMEKEKQAEGKNVEEIEKV